jgi:hypothetical protein
MKRSSAALVVLATLACGTSERSSAPAGRVVAVVQALSASQVTRVNVTVSPAGVSQDLTYNAADGTFAGLLTVPVGQQLVTATAYTADAVYGTGSATADVAERSTAMAYIAILDSSARRPLPDHGPIVTSVTASDVTPIVGQQIQLAASAIDPDGDPISFAWTDGCGGSFGTPTSATTTWSSQTVGSCRVTITVTSRQLSDARAVNLQVRTIPTGQISVTGLVVPQPTIDAVTFSDAQGGSCTALRGGAGADGTCHLPVVGGEPLTVTASASDVISAATFALTNDCGGSFSAQSGSTWSWTAPASGGLCLVTATVAQEGLADAFSVAVFVEPAVLAGRVVTDFIGGSLAVVPADLTSGVVEAFDDAGTRWPGRGDANGNFWFDALPTGVVTIHVEAGSGPPRYHVTARRGYLDLEMARAGRPDGISPTTSTPMTVNVTGVDAAIAYHLQYFDTNGVFVDSRNTPLVVDPFYVGNSSDTLLDTARGDAGLVVQLAPAVAADGTAYTYAARVGTIDPVTVQDGIPTTATATLSPALGVAFTPPPLDAALFDPIDQFTWTAGWGTSARHVIDVHALPTAAYGNYSPSGNAFGLFSADLSAFPSAPALGGLRYGAIPGWTPIFHASNSRCCTSTYSIPGVVYVGFGVAANFVDVLDGGSMQLMGFVHDVTLDGQGALQPLAGVSATPMLAWTAPSTGPVGSYKLVLREITSDGVRMVTNPLPIITTDRTSVRIPAGWLQPGKTYYGSIIATNASPTAPGLNRFPYMTSSVTTGVFTVQ